MYRAGFRKLRCLEGAAGFTANKTYTFKIRLEPHMSIDMHKSFFHIQDEVDNVGAREENQIVQDYVDNYADVVIEGDEEKIRVRSDNHFMNLIGTLRMLINGTVVEEYTGDIGELDSILKRLNNAESYNILKDHANCGKTYLERYMENNISELDWQVTPDISKFWRLTEPILGGIDLQVEVTVHRNYLKRALYTGFGSGAWVAATNTGPAIVDEEDKNPTDIIREYPIVTNDYKMNNLELYLWVDENRIETPKMQPHEYSHSSWKIEKRTLASATTHNFEFFLQKGIRNFGFVFHTNVTGYSAQIQPNDFTGCPLFFRGAPEHPVGNKSFRSATSQALKLTNYEIEFGKNRLPYNTFTQEFVSGSKDITRGQAYISQINYGKTFDMAGSLKNNNFDLAYGPIYFEVFKHIDNDQNVLRLKLVFSEATANLDMFYFYEYETKTVLNYDGSGNCVQVIPSF